MSPSPRLCSLPTPFENDPTLPDWSSYPRPQLRRDSYLSLCGDWSLSVTDGVQSTALGTIRVPFPPESRLSGIERPLAKNEKYVYQKTFTLPKDFNRGRILLHPDAVMQCSEIVINGRPYGTHAGGYLPFTGEITGALKPGENTLTVIAAPIDLEIPYGKQRGKRGGMWYTPISGIWQPVWLESVPDAYISSLRLTPTMNSVTIETSGGEAQKVLRVFLPDGAREYTYEGDVFDLSIDDPILWTPETPHLYEFSLTCGEDVIHSYFALRTVAVGEVKGKRTLLLNGKPYFFHGLLDQGYFSDGIFLPASPVGFANDIAQMKKLGFNMLRKHIKIEPEVFYYECDRQGMIVFQDMVNSGEYSFLIDTALPTVGLKRGITHHATERRRAFFEDSLMATVAHLYNHPSVVYYTIFNEGWGQYDADRLYRIGKAADPTRIWDATSGWFFGRESDVQSEHVYFKALNLRPDGRPLVLSEFGGYSLSVKGHVFNLDKAYGYRTFRTSEDLTEALYRLYADEVIPMIERGLCAAVLTQVSDVEDEINGLLTYDRQVLKVDGARMQQIAQALRKAHKAQWE
ncbi:MAG: glycoside hydrolase family 2 [Clostridia bacterium]|nr:glycoside hydrolase family 2 [Clostridia bacterium]